MQAQINNQEVEITTSKAGVIFSVLAMVIVAMIAGAFWGAVRTSQRASPDIEECQNRTQTQCIWVVVPVVERSRG